MHRFIADIIVVGSGPAGLCIAADLANCGCSVGIVTRDDQFRWPNTYGTWLDEIAGTVLDGCTVAEWPGTQVALDTDDVRDLGRGYCRIDNVAAIRRLSSVLQLNDVTIHPSGVTSVEHDDVGSTVRLTSGGTARAKLIIDATGIGSFTRHQGPPPSLFQYAVGWRVSGAHPYSADSMRLMDFSSEGVHSATDAPSFLYAMPLEGGVFVEETTLISDDEGDFDELTRRLHARLERDGITGPICGSVETVRIPMDVSLPDFTQRVVAFGAASSMVHPATGYSFGRTLKASGPLAQALADGLAEGRSSAALSAIAYAELWPEDAVLAHQLFQFGARFLTTLDTQQTRSFFEAFFSTPRESWVAYLQGDLPAGELAAVMLAVFGACPAGLRLRMVWSGAEWKTAVSAIRSLTRTRRSA